MSRKIIEREPEEWMTLLRNDDLTEDEMQEEFATAFAGTSIPQDQLRDCGMRFMRQFTTLHIDVKDKIDQQTYQELLPPASGRGHSQQEQPPLDDNNSHSQQLPQKFERRQQFTAFASTSADQLSMSSSTFLHTVFTTTVLWIVFVKSYSFVEQSVRFVLAGLINLALAVVVAHHFGWLERWIWFVLETEAKKILNSTKVTMGSFEIDWSELLQGKITLHASNVVIHTPKQKEWQWSSPLIARVGKASVQCNAPICIFHDIFLRKEIPIEAYTVVVSDVQVFVERRDSVINVYLLNPTLVLPPPPERNDKSSVEMEDEDDALSTMTKDEKKDTFDPSENYSGKADTSIMTRKDSSDEQAKILVDEMLHAVQDLGRAATRGELPGAIKQQGLELVDRLRGFRKQDNLEEGIRVIQQVGKAVGESLQSAPRLILPQPDESKKGKAVYCRVGRIVINDMRIFTKDSWIGPIDSRQNKASASTSTSNLANVTTSSIISRNETTTNIKNSISVNNSKKGSWNKPIFIEKMVVRAAELSPPMSLKDEHDLPAIYQNVDLVVETVWKRLLAEMAKSNTGKLFSTAMGEVLSLMITNRRSGKTTTTIAGSRFATPSASLKAD
jgi:hypothetical protein